MSIFKWFGVAALVGTTIAAAACEREAEETKNQVGVVLDDTKEGVDDAVDATREATAVVIDETKGIASATGEAITDGWITTRVHGRFVDETLLKGSDIDVDTQDHVVTLKGTVTSEAAKGRAVAVARNTEGVDQVINQLVVRSK